MASFSWPLNPVSVSGSGGDAQLQQVNKQLERKFGRDIYFRGGFPLTSKGDYVTISGIQNLTEALYRRLLTSPGSYAHVPEYGVGIPLYVKRKMTRETLDEMRLAIRSNLQRDPRVDAVKDILITRKEDSIHISLTVTVVGEELTFTPFQFSEAA